MQIVRNSVKEDQLSNPDIVKDKDIRQWKGWVCEIDNEIVGFVIVDLVDNNIWTLCIGTKFKNQGIGKQLHNMMLNWYFQQTKNPVWLGTSPNTRSEKFYRFSGWDEIGIHGKEVKFQMTFERWQNL